MYEDLGEDEGLEEFKASNKIALIDADTIAYAAASTSEYCEDLLPDDMYLPEELKKLRESEGYWAPDNAVWSTDIDTAIDKAMKDIADLVYETNTKGAELYFTTGRNFRFDVHDMYKANRKVMRYPLGLKEIKEALLLEYHGMICEEFEADDKVVQLKQRHPDKYILAAVDKDVLNAVAGKHYNYYRSNKYKIERKWVEIDSVHAYRWPYFQTLMGDTTDNIRGCPGIGKVKANTALEGLYMPCDMWKAVVKLFKLKGLTVKDAIRDMRLIHMHQLDANDNVVLWSPPCDV